MSGAQTQPQRQCTRLPHLQHDNVKTQKERQIIKRTFTHKATEPSCASCTASCRKQPLADALRCYTSAPAAAAVGAQLTFGEVSLQHLGRQLLDVLHRAVAAVRDGQEAVAVAGAQLLRRLCLPQDRQRHCLWGWPCGDEDREAKQMP